MLFSPPLSGAAAQGAISKDSFATTTGTQAYTRSALVGATLLEVFYDGKALQTRVAPADYSFNSTTGTITFVIIVSTGVEANILYEAAP